MPSGSLMPSHTRKTLIIPDSVTLLYCIPISLMGQSRPFMAKWAKFGLCTFLSLNDKTALMMYSLAWSYNLLFKPIWPLRRCRYLFLSSFLFVPIDALISIHFLLSRDTLRPPPYDPPWNNNKRERDTPWLARYWLLSRQCLSYLFFASLSSYKPYFFGFLLSLQIVHLVFFVILGSFLSDPLITNQTKQKKI